jgi:hypothetical protein
MNSPTTEETMKTAAQFAKECNDKTREWLAANPGAWAGLLSEDQSDWEEQGIFTAEDLDRDQAIETYSDVYKENYGMRPHRNWDGFTAAQIWEAVRGL